MRGIVGRMEPVHYLLLAAVVVPLVGWPIKRAFALRNAGRAAQLRFRHEHGAEVVRLLGQGVEPDLRRGSPWIAIRIGGRDAMFAAARLHRGRLQAGIHLLDVLLPVEVWDADSTGAGAVDVDVIPGVDQDAAEVVARQLGRLGVDSLASGQLGAGLAPVLRVQFDRVADLPELLAEVDTLVDALVALTPEGGPTID